MGTTFDAMEEGGGRFCYVLVVEGFASLITDHASMSAVLAAWTGAGWSSAIPGLTIEGKFAQEIRPWSAEIPVPSLRFIVRGDAEDDSFAEAVFRAKPSFSTRLTQPFDASSGATNLRGQSFAALPASGVVYLGNQRIEYASKTGSTQLNINALKSGTLAPFAIASGGHTYPRPGDFTPGSAGAEATSIPPKITDGANKWIGKWCGLWMHRIVNDVLDLKAQAEVLFAGKIVDIQDAGEATVIEVEDMRGVIRDTMLFDKQFTGYIKRGIRLNAGDQFRLREGSFTSNTFDVLTSGAAGVAQVNAGYYELGDFINKVNAWLAAEYAATRLSQLFSLSIADVGNGPRVMMNTLSLVAQQYFETTNWNYFVFLGMPDGTTAVGGLGGEVGYRGGWYYIYVYLPDNSVSFSFPEEPYTVKVFQPGRGADVYSTPHRTVELESTSGAWVANGEYLPAPYSWYRDAAGDYGFLVVDGDCVLFGKHTSDTRFDEITFGNTIGTVLVHNPGTSMHFGRRIGNDTPMVAKQVVFLGGSFANVVTRLLASINGDGVNHTDYDTYPFGAGIPWELMGQPWLDSLNSIEHAHDTGSIVIFLDRPTRLLEAIASDILLRFAFFVVKSGTLRLTSPTTPNPSLAEWTFDETNKGAPTGQDNPLLSATQVTRDYMRNVFKVEYDRIQSNSYAKFVDFRDAGSIADYGQTQALTIRARNAYSAFHGTGAALKDLISSLIGRAAPIFGRPVRIFRRPINGTLFLGIAPGDTGTFTDDHARDPNTGIRGVSARGVTVMRVSWDLGHDGGELFGEADLMFSDEDRHFPLSPTADVDNTHSAGGFTSGWHAANKQLKLTQHGYSLAGAATDVNAFAAGDEIRITEMDAANPASADDFADNVASTTPGSDIVTVTSGFGVGGRPVFSAAKRYRVTYGAYATVDAGQKLKTFLADEGDGLIVNVIEPNLFAETDQPDTFAGNAGTELWQNQVDATLAEGRPLSTGLIRDLIRAHNSIINYSSAYCLSTVDEQETRTFTTLATYWTPLEYFRVPKQFSYTPPGYKRLITVAPRFRSNTGGTAVEIRVTLGPRSPSGPHTLTSFADSTVPYEPTSGARMGMFSRPFKQLTFSSTIVTFSQVAAQTVEEVAGQRGGFFVTVEGRVPGGVISGTYAGLARFQLGPLVAA